MPLEDRLIYIGVIAPTIPPGWEQLGDGTWHDTNWSQEKEDTSVREIKEETERLKKEGKWD